MHQLQQQQQQQQQKVELWALVVRDPISNPVEVNIFLLLKIGPFPASCLFLSFQYNF